MASWLPWKGPMPKLKEANQCQLNKVNPLNSNHKLNIVRQMRSDFLFGYSLYTVWFEKFLFFVPLCLKATYFKFASLTEINLPK